MANKPCLARLRKEMRSFDPPPFIRAVPLESNIQEWHYVLQGPPDSPYEGGLYHGKLKFPDDFPFRPPAIFMITPNGRFETNRRLCLSISDFHPETWVPTWSVCTILNGVLSFMLETAGTTGAIETTLATKTLLRDGTQAFNAKDAIFCRLFPDLVVGALFTQPHPAADASPAEATGGSDAAGQPGAAGGDSGGTGGAARGPPTDQLAPCGPDGGVGGAAAGAGAGEEAAPSGEEAAGGEAGQGGRNAARNRKKREKERVRRRGEADGGGGESLEEGVPSPPPDGVGEEEQSGPGGDGGSPGARLAALEA